MFEGFTHDRRDIDGVEVAFSVGGSGPPVLLLHGFPQNRTMWARVAPLLAERHTVVCADLRGYGDSAKPACAHDRSNYGFRAMAADQLGLMRTLGFPRFAAIGHDRGGRTAHRMALDHPAAVTHLALLDIVPTHVMFAEVSREVAGAYWHWYFLAQPDPFPERLIAADPDYFYETCLVGWGATRVEDFDQEMLAEYRRTWRDPAAIHGSCSDYRAAATVDFDDDTADLARTVDCPSLVFFGADGVMAALFDIPDTWRPRLSDMRSASVPGGHFFVDQCPTQTAQTLLEFLADG